MNLHEEFEAAHAEHAEILDFLNIWEDSLNLLSDDDINVRCRGLRNLQIMDGKIAEICDHCRQEETEPTSPLFQFTDTEICRRLKDEHFHLCRANFQFRRELVFTTTSFTDEVAHQGETLLNALRAHIAFEEQLLSHLAREERHLQESTFEPQRCQEAFTHA